MRARNGCKLQTVTVVTVPSGDGVLNCWSKRRDCGKYGCSARAVVKVAVPTDLLVHSTVGPGGLRESAFGECTNLVGVYGAGHPSQCREGRRYGLVCGDGLGLYTLVQ